MSGKAVLSNARHQTQHKVVGTQHHPCKSPKQGGVLVQTNLQRILPNILEYGAHRHFKFYSKLMALFTGPFLQWQRDALRHIVKWKSETGQAAFNYSSEQQKGELACQANGEWCLEEQCIYVSNILSGQSQNINRLAIKAKGHSRAAKGVTINYQVRARVQVLVWPVTAQSR